MSNKNERTFLRINVCKDVPLKNGGMREENVWEYVSKSREKEFVLKNYRDITDIISKEIGEEEN